MLSHSRPSPATTTTPSRTRGAPPVAPRPAAGPSGPIPRSSATDPLDATLARAVRARADKALLMRQTGVAEKRHGALVKELAGSTTDEYLDKLYRTMWEAIAEDRSVGRVFPRILDALLNLNRLHQGNGAQVKTAYATYAAARPPIDNVQCPQDLDAALAQATKGKAEGLAALKRAYQDGEMTPEDELRLGLGALTHKRIRGAGDTKQAMELLEQGKITDLQVLEEPKVKEAISNDTKLRKYVDTYKARDAAKKTAASANATDQEKNALRAAEVAHLASRLRPLVYETSHEFWRGHQGTTQLGAMEELIRSWIASVDTATRELALRQDGPVRTLLGRWRHRHAGHTVSAADAAYLVALIRGSFIRDVGVATTDTTESELEVEAFIAWLDREHAKTHRNPLAAKFSDHKRLVDAAFDMSETGRESVLAHLDPNRDRALAELRRHLQAAGVHVAQRAVVAMRFRNPRGELGEGMRKLAELVYTYAEDGEGDFERDVRSRIFNLSPQELVVVRSDRDLHERMMKHLATGDARTRIQRLLRMAGPHQSAAMAAPDDATIEARSDALKKSPEYWAEVFAYEFDKHASRLSVNSQKLAGLVQDAVWSLGARSAGIVTKLRADRADVLSAMEWIEPALVTALRNGAEISVQERLRIARRGILTHDEQIEDIIEQTPDAKVLGEWSNVAKLYALFDAKRTARTANDDRGLTTAVKAIDDFVIDIKPSAYNLIHAELHSLFGKSKRLVTMENAIRAKIARSLSKDATFSKLVWDGAISRDDAQIMAERLLTLGSIRTEHLSKTGVQHGILWRKLDVLATERKTDFALLLHEHRAIRSELERTATPGARAHFLEQGEGFSEARKDVLKRRLSHLKERRETLSAVTEEWLAARTKFNEVIKTIVHIALATLIAGFTGGIAGPVSFAAAVLISVVNAAATVALKGFDFSLAWLLEGGADVTVNETVRGLIRHLIIEPGLKAATAAATFGLRDIMPSVSMPGSTMRAQFRYEPGGELNPETLADQEFGARLAGKTTKQIITSQMERSAEMSAYKAMEVAIMKSMEQTGDTIWTGVERVVDSGRATDRHAVEEALAPGVGGYMNTMLTEFVTMFTYSTGILRGLGEAWSETPDKEDGSPSSIADAVKAGPWGGDYSGWAGTMNSEFLTGFSAETKAALEAGIEMPEAPEGADYERVAQPGSATPAGRLGQLAGLEHTLEQSRTALQAKAVHSAADRKLLRKLNEHIPRARRGVAELRAAIQAAGRTGLAGGDKAMTLAQRRIDLIVGEDLPRKVGAAVGP